MVKELLQKDSFDEFYLTTGRILAQYNNAAQTKRSKKLQNIASEDIVLVSYEDEELVRGKEYIRLVSKYGRSNLLRFKLSKSIKRGTLYVSFHHAISHINYLFGDESDELTKTALLKSIKVKIE
jgi:formate dehydrogenase major subunit